LIKDIIVFFIAMIHMAIPRNVTHALHSNAPDFHSFLHVCHFSDADTAVGLFVTLNDITSNIYLLSPFSYCMMMAVVWFEYLNIGHELFYYIHSPCGH
jgi:hypothetical protein